MNKVVFPALLVATIMVAGAFAFMPVEQASTVHASGALEAASTIRTEIPLDLTLTTLEGSGKITFGVAADEGPFNIDQLMLCNYSGFGTMKISTNTEFSDVGTGNLAGSTGQIMSVTLNDVQGYCWDIIPTFTADGHSAGDLQLRGDGSNDVVILLRNYSGDPDNSATLVAYVSGISDVSELELDNDLGDSNR